MRRTLLLLVLAAGAGADDAAVANAQGIAKAGPDAARERIPELIEIGKGGPRERFAARDALVVAGAHAVAPLLEGASGDASLRLLLEGVCHDLGAAVVAPALPALASENAAMRAMAAVALGAAGKGGEAAVKKLIEALYDPDAAVRREAATALGRIGRGAHDAIPGLILLANDRERACTREGILALGMILRDAAERARPAPKVAPEVATAIEKGLAWLAANQQPGGGWEVPGVMDTPKMRIHVTALACLALLEGGAADRSRAQLYAGLRLLDDPDASESAAAALCAAARVLGDPEFRAAAERQVAAGMADGGHEPGWLPLALLEADFAGIVSEHGDKNYILQANSEPHVEMARVLLAARADPRPEKVRELVESKPQTGWDDIESRILLSRARRYAGIDSDVLATTVREAQSSDGSWGTKAPDVLGRAWRTAAALLCLEAASGLAHPLTMPLPDAAQLKAAVATLQLAAQSKEPEIRSAAEQALAGFGR